MKTIIDNTFKSAVNGTTLKDIEEEEVEHVAEAKPEMCKLSAAEKMYSRHLTNVKKYKKKNPEKMKLKAKIYRESLKKDKKKYDLFLEKRRNYYNNVYKLNKQNKLVEAHEALPTTLVI